MKVITPDEYRAKFAPRSFVTLSDGASVFEVKGIDLNNLVLHGRLDADVVNAMTQRAQAWRGMSPEAVALDIAANAQHIGAFIDAVVCGGAVSPRVAREPHLADSGALWIDEIDLAAKLQIVLAVVNLSTRQAPAAVAGVAGA